MSQPGHHGVHGGHGGDGANFAQGLDMGHQGHGHGGHNFLSQLLGLNQDHGAHGAHGHGQHGLHHAHEHAAHGGPSQSAGWNSALQALKLSDALQGINVTPNFLFLVLFVGFTGWLFVVYWIRHHEPLANTVLGTGAAHSATAEADRRLVAGIKRTLPVRVSKDSGDIYVPGATTAPFPNEMSHSQCSGSAAYAVSPEASMPLPPPPLPTPPGPQPQPTPLGVYGYAAPQPYAAPPQDAYLVPIQASAGTRVKMIVNR